MTVHRPGGMAGSVVEGGMGNRALLNLILRDEALTRGLDDPEARILVERLADWSEACADRGTESADVLVRIERFRRRGRAIRQFVDLWCHRCEHAAAIQLAASERFRWPLPEPDADPWALMHQILDWEVRDLVAA